MKTSSASASVRKREPRDFDIRFPAQGRLDNRSRAIFAPALNTIAGGPSRLHEGSRTTLHAAIDALVKRAKRSGDLRRDLDSYDLLRALIGVSHIGSGADWQQSAKRLVDILIAGSRPPK